MCSDDGDDEVDDMVNAMKVRLLMLALVDGSEAHARCCDDGGGG